MEFFLNVFREFAEFIDKKIDYSKRTCYIVTSCVRDQHATTVPVQHMWGAGSLNSAQFTFQWFFRFPEFAEFSENFSHLGKTPMTYRGTIERQGFGPATE